MSSGLRRPEGEAMATRDGDRFLRSSCRRRPRSSATEIDPELTPTVHRSTSESEVASAQPWSNRYDLRHLGFEFGIAAFQVAHDGAPYVGRRGSIRCGPFLPWAGIWKRCQMFTANCSRPPQEARREPRACLRRIATRYEKTDKCFASMVNLVATVLWTR